MKKYKSQDYVKKIMKELKDLIYRQADKHKSYNTLRRVNRLGLKKDEQCKSTNR